MKLTRNLIFGMMAATSAVAVAGVGVTVAQEGLGFKNAEAVTPMRRIWVVNLNSGWWGTEQKDGKTIAGFQIHAWNSDSQSYDSGLVQCHGGDYEGGTFFCDIPANMTNIVFHENKGWNDKTDDLTLPAFGQADVWWLSQSRRTEYNNRECTVGTMPMKTTGQLSHLLSFYDTCSDSQANGYMSYPQIKKNFVESSSGLKLSETVYTGAGEQGYEGKLPTIQEKLDAMRLKYEAATK